MAVAGRLRAERRTPGSSADSVVWADVTRRPYEDTELNWTYASFMTSATLIATVAIVLDSQMASGPWSWVPSSVPSRLSGGPGAAAGAPCSGARPGRCWWASWWPSR